MFKLGIPKAKSTMQTEILTIKKTVNGFNAYITTLAMRYLLKVRKQLIDEISAWLFTQMI